MKKKLLLGIMFVLIFTCMLVISISAASTNEFGTVEKSDTIDLTGMATDTDLRVVLYDGTEYHTYPAQYIVTNATDITLNFEKINSAFSKEYTKASVIRIEIPRHVLKIVSGWFNYANNDNLVEVFFPSDSQVYYFAWGCFEQSDSLEKINLPRSLTEYNGQNHFTKCYKLKEVTFDEGYSVSYIPLNFFQSCTSLETIVFPNCVTEIRGGAFGSCSNLKTIVFGAKLQTMAGSMSDCATGGSVWYLPETFYSSSVTSEPPSNMFHWAGEQTNGVSGTGNNPKNITFVYTGTKEQALALQARFKAADQAIGENCVGLSRIYNATVCTEAEYEVLTGKKVGEIATGYYLVYDYSQCKAFYNDNHINKEELVYGDNRYFEEANIATVCTRCPVKDVKQTLAPLFKSLGYSYSTSAVMQGFAIDRTSLEDYEAYYVDKEITFGLVAVVESNAQDGMLLSSTKKAQVDYTDEVYDIFEMKVTGLVDEKTETSLFICGYVKIDEEIYYLNEGKCAESAVGFAFSYKSITSNE